MKSVRRLYYKFIHHTKRLLASKLYVSFGENCLTDDILRRHKLKSFSTLFSHGRSNVEYILQMERDNYKDALNVEHIEYGYTPTGDALPRLKIYNEIANSYNPLHMNGFEYTHHDVIKSEELRIQLRRRIKRMHSYIGKKRYIILYHHRYSSEVNKDKLLADLLELKRLYSAKNKRSEVVLFMQNFVSEERERKLTYQVANGLHIFTFHTLNEWAGDNPTFLWAKCDDDLIAQMISKIKSL